VPCELVYPDVLDVQHPNLSDAVIDFLIP